MAVKRPKKGWASVVFGIEGNRAGYVAYDKQGRGCGHLHRTRKAAVVCPGK